MYAINKQQFHVSACAAGHPQLQWFDEGIHQQGAKDELREVPSAAKDAGATEARARISGVRSERQCGVNGKEGPSRLFWVWGEGSGGVQIVGRRPRSCSCLTRSLLGVTHPLPSRRHPPNYLAFAVGQGRFPQLGFHARAVYPARRVLVQHAEAALPRRPDRARLRETRLRHWSPCHAVKPGAVQSKHVLRRDPGGGCTRMMTTLGFEGRRPHTAHDRQRDRCR